MTAATRSLRRWGLVHKWTSLICTIFMLLLCITGLPLIFHEEIDDFLHSVVKPAEVAPGTPKADLDKLLANAIEKAPVKVPHFLIWDRDDPNAMFVSFGDLEAFGEVDFYRDMGRHYFRLLEVLCKCPNPGLTYRAKLYPGHTHTTILGPALNDALLYLYGPHFPG